MGKTTSAAAKVLTFRCPRNLELAVEAATAVAGCDSRSTFIRRALERATAEYLSDLNGNDPVPAGTDQ